MRAGWRAAGVTGLAMLCTQSWMSCRQRGVTGLAMLCTQSWMSWTAWSLQECLLKKKQSAIKGSFNMS